MHKTNIVKTKIEKRLLEVIDQHRSLVLDPLEIEIGHLPIWKAIRSRLLKAMGDRGLAGRVTEILNAEFNSNGGSNECF